ncbi:MAG: hypothetical protein OXN22_02775 [Deltaproteobacteria bacterium]|nr:hypothetical protein [Deltaproteobacteria bacterium]
MVGLDPRGLGWTGRGPEREGEGRAVHGVNRRVGEGARILLEGGQNDAGRLGSRLQTGVVMSVTVRAAAVPVMVMGVGVVVMRVGTGLVRRRLRRGRRGTGSFKEVEEVVDAMGRASDEERQVGRGGK